MRARRVSCANRKSMFSFRSIVCEVAARIGSNGTRDGKKDCVIRLGASLATRTYE